MSAAYKQDTKTQNQLTNTDSKTDPWGPTKGYLEAFLSRLDDQGSKVGGAPSTDETNAFAQLKANAAAPNPFQSDIEGLAKKLFSVESTSPMVKDAYSTLTDQLTPYASGANLDLKNNPHVAEMLAMTSDDAQNRINSMFAGAGRDLSGKNVQAVGRGITEAQLPVLSNLFERGQDRQIDAAKTLFGAGTNTAQLSQGLDIEALMAGMSGIDASNAAIASKNAGPEAMLDLERRIKAQPFEEMGWLAQYLFPIAGLGQQTQGTQHTVGNSRSRQFGVSADLKDLGNVMKVAGL